MHVWFIIGAVLLLSIWYPIAACTTTAVASPKHAIAKVTETRQVSAGRHRS